MKVWVLMRGEGNEGGDIVKAWSRRPRDVEVIAELGSGWTKHGRRDHRYWLKRSDWAKVGRIEVAP